MPELRRLLTGILLLAVLTGTSASQETPPGPVSAGLAGASTPGRVSYDAGYFANYNVSNAEDMVRLVPGAGAILDATAAASALRGFGAGGTQVLIGGRRFPGKSNEIAGNLRRIAPASVERIELISGAAEGITTQSNGILLNIVLRPGTSVADVGAWELANRFNNKGRSEFDGLISYAGSRSGWTYKAGIERNVWSPASSEAARWSDRTRAEAYFYPSNALQELRPQVWHRDHNKWIYTGGLRYDSVGGRSFELNGFFQTLVLKQTDSTAFTRFSNSGQPTSSGSDDHTNAINPYALKELSGEFQSPLGAGALDALIILNRSSQPTVDVRNQLRANTLFEISRSQLALRRSEDIARLVWTRPLTGRRSLEVGVEAARNTLDQNLQVFFDLNGDSRVEPVAIPTAIAHVQEVRGEAFAILRATGGGRTSFEGGLTYERSRITNNYPFSPGTSLGYLRPRLDIRFTGKRSGQFRTTIERKISQLDFTNFVPKFNVIDSRIDAGNPQLRPEQTWSFELGYQQRLGLDAGLIEVRAYFDDITDAIDKVPLLDARGLYSASGNIPAARRWGAELKSSLRLAPLGLRNALLSARYLYQQSSVRDPFTGIRRRIGTDAGNTYDVTFRHDLLRLGASYGFTYRESGGATVSSDLLVIAALTVDPVLEAFAEKKLPRGLVLRIEGQNIGGAHNYQNRSLYAPNAIDGTVLRREYFDESRDTRIAVRLRGQF